MQKVTSQEATGGCVRYWGPRGTSYWESNGRKCERCGTECVDRCDCGAPQCCPKCCLEAEEEWRQDRAKELENLAKEKQNEL